LRFSGRTGVPSSNILMVVDSIFFSFFWLRFQFGEILAENGAWLRALGHFWVWPWVVGLGPVLGPVCEGVAEWLKCLFFRRPPRSLAG
jgi:hypothetical protein